MSLVDFVMFSCFVPVPVLMFSVWFWFGLFVVCFVEVWFGFGNFGGDLLLNFLIFSCRLPF